MRSLKWLIVLTALIASSSGCGDDDGGICDTGVDIGLQVKVTDAATGLPAADGAIGWAIEGEYSDSLEVTCWSSVPTCLSGLEERPGTYTVLIYKPGYQPWSRSGVEVTPNDCGVETTVLEAKLVSLE